MSIHIESRALVEVSRWIEASPERVFDAWLQPEIAKTWLFATPTGQMVHADIDPRVGGRFTFVRRDGDDVEHVGTYLEIDRPHRLAFDFAVPKYSKEVTTVRVDITPDGNGSMVKLTHEGVLADYAQRTKEGWTAILNNLAIRLGES